ncbi:hypothetical protein NP493_251g03035 [Ridgeia piscesae]|uniref:Uncharacterized protein n=1 Tax=Ridgeia piscesae TaxID=27915 RepID=A0AAD9UD21_RIDPI|nr:hypothetical protein NP493_251g03035 [Ridgeia piscesae]
MPLTMPKPMIPVRTNRTIQLRRMNTSNPDDMQENTYGKLTVIEYDKKRAEEVKHRKMAPRKAHLATEDRGARTVTERRDAMFPKVPDSVDVSPVSHILHSVAEVLDENAHDTEGQGETDGKGDGGGSRVKAMNAHLDTLQKVDSWCRSTKEAVLVGSTSDEGDVGAETTEKPGQRSDSCLYVGRSSQQATDNSSPETRRLKQGSQVSRRTDQGSQLRSRTEQGSQAHRRLEQAQKRQQLTLDEPFTTYRRSRDGRLIVSELPYRRKKFPMPGRKEPSILPKLRKLAVLETERNRQRMILFAEGLDKFDEWDPLQYIRSLRPPEEREHEVAPPPPREDFFNVNDVFNRYYAQLLDGLDPNSAEAMKYCRYIRADADKQPVEENIWE